MELIKPLRDLLKQNFSFEWGEHKDQWSGEVFEYTKNNDGYQGYSMCKVLVMYPNSYRKLKHFLIKN